MSSINRPDTTTHSLNRDLHCTRKYTRIQPTVQRDCYAVPVLSQYCLLRYPTPTTVVGDCGVDVAVQGRVIVLISYFLTLYQPPPDVCQRQNHYYCVWDPTRCIMSCNVDPLIKHSGSSLSSSRVLSRLLPRYLPLLCHLGGDVVAERGAIVIGYLFSTLYRILPPYFLSTSETSLSLLQNSHTNSKYSPLK